MASASPVFSPFVSRAACASASACADSGGTGFVSPPAVAAAAAAAGSGDSLASCDLLIDFPCRELGGGGGAFFLVPNCTVRLESDSPPSAASGDIAGLVASMSREILSADSAAPVVVTCPSPVCPVISSRLNASTSSEPLATLAALSAAPSSLLSSMRSSCLFAFSRSSSVLLKGFAGGGPRLLAAAPSCGVGTWLPKGSSDEAADGEREYGGGGGGRLPASRYDQSGVSGDSGGGESTRTFLTTLLFFLSFTRTPSSASSRLSASSAWPSWRSPGGLVAVRKVVAGGGWGGGGVGDVELDEDDVYMGSIGGICSWGPGWAPPPCFRKGLDMA